MSLATWSSTAAVATISDGLRSFEYDEANRLSVAKVFKH